MIIFRCFDKKKGGKVSFIEFKAQIVIEEVIF